MNVVKYRPTGRTGPVTRVRVSQSKSATHFGTNGRTRPHSLTVKRTDALMFRKGYTRVNKK